MYSWVSSTRRQCLRCIHDYGRRDAVRLRGPPGEELLASSHQTPTKLAFWTAARRWQSSVPLATENDSSVQPGSGLEKSQRSAAGSPSAEDRPVKYVRYTPEQIETILKMRNDGYTLHEIAEETKRPYRGVEQMIRRHGGPDRLDDPEKRRNARYTQIASPTASNTGIQVSRRAPQFTDEEIDQLMALRKAGLTLSDISTKMKRSVSAISFKIYRDPKFSHLFAPGLNRNELTIDQLDQIIALRLQGMSWKSIQRDHYPGQNIHSLNHTYQNSLRTKMDHADFLTDKHEYTADEDAEICRLREETRLEWREIAYHLHRSHSAVENRYRRLRSPAEVVNINRYRDYQPSEQQLAEIKRLRDERGLSFSAISTVLGGEYTGWFIRSLYLKMKRTPKTKAKELSDRYLPWTPEEDTQIQRFKEQGVSLTDMESHVSGRTAQSIELRLQRLSKVKDDLHVHRWYSPEEDRRIIRMREEGNPWRVIAEACKRPVHGVRHRYVRLVGPNAVKGNFGRPKNNV